jgi:rhodanese-related sulfurtransferase
MKKIFALTAVSLVALSLHAGEYKDISIKELKSDIASHKVTLLDANGTESWEKGHIPGAVNFYASQDKLASALPADKGALVVAYCANPRCKAYQAAAKAAEKLGYTNIRHLSAGIDGWKDAGEKTEAKSQVKTEARK